MLLKIYINVCWSYCLTILQMNRPCLFPSFFQNLLTQCQVCVLALYRLVLDEIPKKTIVHYYCSWNGRKWRLLVLIMSFLSATDEVVFPKFIFKHAEVSLLISSPVFCLFYIYLFFLYTKAPVIFPFGVWIQRDVTVMRVLVWRKI